jgi:hypothetical protein
MASDVAVRSVATAAAQEARSSRADQPHSGPDFICIGMPKAGTTWLYDQLKHHPEFWMPPVKEINYLIGASRAMKNTVRQVEFSRRNRGGGRRIDPHDYGFLEEAAASASEPRNFERYASLFRFKGERFSGDVSPKYSSLGPVEVAEIARHLPKTKILLLVRDPIARFWSGISMLNRKGKLDVCVLENEGAFRSFLAKKGAREQVLPTVIFERWRQHTAALQFRHFFLDDIEHRPNETRRSILKFLGADPETANCEVSANHNRKSAAPKLAMPEYARAVLVEHFAQELRACAGLLGGAAEGWPARYGL